MHNEFEWLRFEAITGDKSTEIFVFIVGEREC